MELPEIETVQGVPEATRGPGGGALSPYTELMQRMKAPVGNKHQSFFVPANEAPEEIVDEGEREKELKANAAKLANRFNGLGRRITKQDGAFRFAFRIVRQNPEDDSTPLGVRVYRVKANG